MKKRVLLFVLLLVLLPLVCAAGLDFFSEELEKTPTQEGGPRAQEPASQPPRRSRPTPPVPGSTSLTPSELEEYRSSYLSALRAVQRGGFPRRLIYVYSLGHGDPRSQEAIITAKTRDPTLNISAFAVVDCTRPEQLRALTRSPFHAAGIEVFVDCQNSVLTSYGISQLPALVIDHPPGQPVVFSGARVLEGLP
jgi:hypothetical protein